MLKSSAWIKEMSEKNSLLDPFTDKSVRDNVISFGLGPYGYDLRLDREFKKIRRKNKIIDPHSIKDSDYETITGDKILIEPNSYILGKSLEYIKMPKKILGIVFGKSTYARCGILVNVTPVEPEWEGHLTISISNVSGNSATLHPLQGIAQIIFLESNENPVYSYKDLKGKYNNQDGITISKV
ncbi:MAG: dCTP deaminase [Acidobacteriota bacterium]